MGLDVHVSVVCGVLASDVFPAGYRVEREIIQTVNPLGEPTGMTATLTEWYLDCPLASFLVADNKNNLSADPSTVNMAPLFAQSDYRQWVHFSDHCSSKLSQYVFGLKILGDTYSVERYDFNYSIALSGYDVLAGSVERKMFEKFAYKGEPRLISVVQYSY